MINENALLIMYAVESRAARIFIISREKFAKFSRICTASEWKRIYIVILPSHNICKMIYECIFNESERKQVKRRAHNFECRSNQFTNIKKIQKMEICFIQQHFNGIYKHHPSTLHSFLIYNAFIPIALFNLLFFSLFLLL